MASAIKIRRAGIGVGFARKVPFRAWLDEQPRKELTYRKELPDHDGTGWRHEDFVFEAMKRGVDVRWGTVLKWATGSQPRWSISHQLKKAFPTIKF